MATVETRPTEYTVCALPEDDINAGNFQIKVAYRGRGLWAVLRHRWCLGADGEWDYESIPSEREDEWLAGHRFQLDAALRLAAEHVLKLTVNGWTVADALAAAERRKSA
ncbi:hypothetical protein [Micromonospora rubida]